METVKGRSVRIGQRVNVYVNLNQTLNGQSRFSIVDAEPKNRKTTHGLVLAYASSVLLQSPVFKVSEKGRQRVIESQRKAVHAYVHGILVAVDEEKPEELTREINYFPYVRGDFHTKDGESVSESGWVYLKTMLYLTYH